MSKDLDAFLAKVLAKEQALDHALVENKRLLAQVKAAQGETKQVRDKLRRALEQRDAHKARCGELRQHITRYQAEVVKLRGAVTALPWGPQP